MREAVLAAVAVLMLGLGPMLGSGAAVAQINPFGNAQGNVLSNDDFAIMNAAAAKLLARPHLTVGSSEKWTNPASGSSGTISVQGNFTRKPWACHTIGYQIAPNGRPVDGVAVLDWCKTKDGWKIA